MAEQKLPTRAEDFSEWYNQLVLKAELADYAPVRGCMIVRPYGWALWENIQPALDKRFKATGHVNAAFPLLIPKSFIEKEQSHVAGFSPELAVVTIGGGEELEEPLVIRPTSETIIGHAYAKWIQSYRDLPVLINQWNSVVRWELRTKLFLRTLEFFWQEGHTAHATFDEAEAETRQMLDIYTDFAVNEAAVPVIPGRKSASERFAGADQTYSIEAMMGDGKALQAGTSHNLGQNFSKAFAIRYLDKAPCNSAGPRPGAFPRALSARSSWCTATIRGSSCRRVWLPRRWSSCPSTKTMTRKPSVRSRAQAKQTLVDAGIRVHTDEREGSSPGFKFNDWEMRGVPLRIEMVPRTSPRAPWSWHVAIGPARKKVLRAAGGIGNHRYDPLVEIQKALLDRARAFRDAIPKSQRPTTSSRPPSKLDLPPRIGAGKNSARPRSRKKPRPRSAAFPSTIRGPRHLHSCAPNPGREGHLRPRLLTV